MKAAEKYDVIVFGAGTARKVMAWILAKAQGGRYLLIHGRRDPVIPYSEGEAARDRLVEAGAKCEWLPNDGVHTLDSDVTEVVGAFAAKVLGA